MNYSIYIVFRHKVTGVKIFRNYFNRNGNTFTQEIKKRILDQGYQVQSFIIA
jgi:hypothetical protein